MVLDMVALTIFAICFKFFYRQKHKALQKFYEEIVERADDFAEAYQGKYNLIGPISLMNANKTTNIVDGLEVASVKFLNALSERSAPTPGAAPVTGSAA